MCLSLSDKAELGLVGPLFPVSLVTGISIRTGGHCLMEGFEIQPGYGWSSFSEENGPLDAPLAMPAGASDAFDSDSRMRLVGSIYAWR